MRRALIVGIAGQDGSYLAESLRGDGYSVTGVGRGDVDLACAREVDEVLRVSRPDEVYYLAAQHASSQSGDAAAMSEVMHATNYLGLMNFLEAIVRQGEGAKVFYASSSLVFTPGPQKLDEQAPMVAVDAYTQSKIAATGLCREYRRQGVFASVGILFNHESPRRPADFLSMKVVAAAVDIKKGKRDELSLGNLSAKVDWGYAPDFVRGMRLIMSHPVADDFVLATGELHAVEDLCRIAFSELGLDHRDYVREDRSLLSRSNHGRCGDATKALRLLGWKPKVSFEEMIRLLVRAQMEAR